MKIIVLCYGTATQPTLEALHSQGLLAGVAAPKNTGEIDITMPLEAAARQASIPFLRVTRAELAGQLGPWLHEIAPDAVCTIGFPYKIPESVLSRPRLGFFNFHGGVLPAYRGPDPVFWQIKNREPHGAIAVHRITPDIDAGGIALIERVPIGPDDTYGLYMQRLGAVLPRVMIEFVQQLVIKGDELPLDEQVPASAHYYPRPTGADLTIDWSRPAAEINALVRACNPLHGGALSMLKGIPVRLFQATMAHPRSDDLASSGTIVTASVEEGIRVVCAAGETLYIDIVYGADGFFTGSQLVKIFGLRQGDRMS